MFNELYGLSDKLNKMFYGSTERSFPVDVIEGDGFYLVNAEIPGVDKDKIEVTFENSTLTIKAEANNNNSEKKYVINERGKKNYERKFYFGDIEEESLSAKYENGILSVTINLKKPEEKQKRVITIE